MLTLHELRITARSLGEGIAALRNGCRHLDFTHNMHLSSQLVNEVQLAKKAVGLEISDVPDTIQNLKTREDLIDKRDQISSRLIEMQSPAISFFQSVTNNSVLESLRLEYKSLGDDAIESLSKSLSKLSSLALLDLSANYMTPIGAEALGFELRYHGLRELHLDSNQLQNHGVHRLGLAMQGNTTLHVLSLRANGIGPDLPAGFVLLLTKVEAGHSDDELLDEGSDPPVPACMLRELNLDRNCIEIIPIRLGACVNLRQLTLDGNPAHSRKVQRARPAAYIHSDLHGRTQPAADGWPHMFQVLRAELAEEEARRRQQVPCHRAVCVVRRASAAEARRRAALRYGALKRGTKVRGCAALALTLCDCRKRWCESSRSPTGPGCHGSGEVDPASCQRAEHD